MAHKKAGGSTNNGRDSQSKRLGVKRFGGQVVKEALKFTQVLMFVKVKTTHCLQQQAVR